MAFKPWCGQCMRWHGVEEWEPVDPLHSFRGWTVIGDRHLPCGRRQHLVLEPNAPRSLADVDLFSLKLYVVDRYPQIAALLQKHGLSKSPTKPQG